jgi:hypothetical protein
MKNDEIDLMKKCYIKKIKNTTNMKNVIYMITNDPKKKKFIIGKTIDLNKRLCMYNKSCKHEIVYTKEFNGPSKILNLIEYMTLMALDPYREQSNVDRFVLPDDKTINFFTDIINCSFDNAVDHYKKINKI